MSLPGIDYSFARPVPAVIHAAGYRFAGRYLDPGSKGITRAEADHLTAAGIWIVVTYETSAQWMLGGYSAGQAAAESAQSLGRAAGMPSGRPVFFAADFDASEAQIPAVLACLSGCASVLGRNATGVYGGLAVVRAALDAGFTWAWQTCAWSGGAWDPRAQLRQVRVNTLLGSSAIDVNEAVAADYGQWMPGTLPAAPVPQLPEGVTVPEMPGTVVSVQMLGTTGIASDDVQVWSVSGGKLFVARYYAATKKWGSPTEVG